MHNMSSSHKLNDHQTAYRFDRYPAPMTDTTFRFIDLFAGIGGFRIAMEAAGGKCVFTSEIDRWCRETYTANFDTNHPLRGDIREVHEDDIPDFDVLVAGFPCQPFSIAGVSKKRALGQPEGFACDTQGTLFFDIARILAARRPRAFLLENVRNLVSHDGGRTFAVIHETLERELGYEVHWRILNAKHWLPQHRERIFIVGFREPTTFDLHALPVPDLPGPTMRSIFHPEDGSEHDGEPYVEGTQGKVSPKYILSEHLWTYLKAYARRHKARGNGFGYGLVGPDDVSRTLSARYYKDGSEILVKRGKTGRGRPRRLTPRECARLMGFDKPGQCNFAIPVSDAQAYRQFGNAVAVPVATAVADLLRAHLPADQPANAQLAMFSRERELAWT